MEVHDGCQVEPALGGVDVGEVGHPDLVGGRGRWSLREAIRGNRVIMVAVCGMDAVSTTLAAIEPATFHQSSHTVATMAAALSAEFTNDPGRSVGLAALGVEEGDPLG